MYGLAEFDLSISRLFALPTCHHGDHQTATDPRRFLATSSTHSIVLLSPADEFAISSIRRLLNLNANVSSLEANEVQRSPLHDCGSCPSSRFETSSSGS